MFSAKQGITTGTIFITSFVWHGPNCGLNPGPPALEASTLPLGYRGGRDLSIFYRVIFIYSDYTFKIALLFPIS